MACKAPVRWSKYTTQRQSQWFYSMKSWRSWWHVFEIALVHKHFILKVVIKTITFKIQSLMFVVVIVRSYSTHHRLVQIVFDWQKAVCENWKQDIKFNKPKIRCPPRRGTLPTRLCALCLGSGALVEMVISFHSFIQCIHCLLHYM